jgi:mycothiol synthase
MTTDTILKTAPTTLPEGYTLRQCRMEDAQEILDMLHLCTKNYGSDDQVTLDDFISEWHSPGFKMETDLQVIVSPDDEIVGYSEVWATAETPVHPWAYLRIHPEHQGLGLEEALFAWAEARSRQVFETVPPEARVSIYVGAPDKAENLKAVFAGLGLPQIRASYQMRIDMEGPPPASQWPEGIELRPYRHPQDLEAVYRADDEAFQDHFGYTPDDFERGLAHFKHHMVEDSGFDPELWFVAWDGDEIAGLSLCREQGRTTPEIGWVRSLAVRRPWRKRGLGLALLQHSFGELYRCGQHSVGLGVDGSNLTGALRLYERAGMHIHYQFNLYEKELRVGKELATVEIDE